MEENELDMESLDPEHLLNESFLKEKLKTEDYFRIPPCSEIPDNYDDLNNIFSGGSNFFQDTEMHNPKNSDLRWESSDEIKNTAESFNPTQIPTIPTSEEPAVLLVDDAQETNLDTPEVWSFPSKNLKILFNSGKKMASEENTIKEKEEKFSLVDFIMSTVAELSEKQKKIDQWIYKKKGPGRQRKNKAKTTVELQECIKEYLNTNLRLITNKGGCKDRKDALITIAMRCIKKLPYHLIEKCSARNLYKKSSISCFMFSFIESYCSFIFSQGNQTTSDIIKGLCEYSIIYFPQFKCTTMIDHLKLEQIDHYFLLKQIELLNARDKTSKKNIKGWIQNSTILKQIFELALEVLTDSSFPKNSSSKHLVTCISGFLR